MPTASGALHGWVAQVSEARKAVCCAPSGREATNRLSPRGSHGIDAESGHQARLPVPKRVPFAVAEPPSVAVTVPWTRAVAEVASTAQAAVRCSFSSPVTGPYPEVTAPARGHSGAKPARPAVRQASRR